MPVCNLQKIVQPRGGAVIRASRKATSLGRTVLENVIDAGFPGPMYPVNPKYKKVYVRASRLPTGPRGFA